MIKPTFLFLIYRAHVVYAHYNFFFFSPHIEEHLAHCEESAEFDKKFIGLDSLTRCLLNYFRLAGTLTMTGTKL